MRRAGRIAVWGAGLLLLAALVVCVAALAASLGWQRERVRGAVEAALADALGDAVAIGGIEGPLLPRLVVSELRIGPGDAPSLAVERLELRVALRRSLATRSLVLRSAHVRGAHLALSRDDRGEWDLPAWLEAPDAADAGNEATLPVRVERTEIEDLSARIGWREASEAAAVVVSGSASLASWSLPAAPGQALRGRVRARARADGRATRWLDEARVEATLEGRRLALETLELAGGGRPALRLAEPTVLTIGDESLAIEPLELRGEGQALLIQGSFTRDAFRDLRLEARDLDLALAGPLSFGSVAAPGGRLTGTLALDGPFLRPRGRVDLVWSEPRLLDWRAEHATLRASGDGRDIQLEALTVDGTGGGPLRLARPARLRFHDGGVDIAGLELRSERQSIVANGSVTPERFRGFVLELRGIDLTRAARLLGLEPAPGGTLGGEVRLDGDLARPEGRVDLVWSEPRLLDWRAEHATLRASGDGRDVQLEALTVDGTGGGPLRLARPARLRFHDGGVDIAGLELRSERQSIVANGSVTPERFRDFVLELRGIDLTRAARLLGLEPAPGGTLAGDVRLDGALARPDGRADLVWSEPQLAGWRGERVVLGASLDADGLRGDARFVRVDRDEHVVSVAVPAEAFERAARDGWPDPREAGLPEGLRVTLRSDAAAIATFAPLLPEALRGLSGSLTGELELRGGTSPRVGGRLALADAALAIPGRDPIESLSAVLELRPEPGLLRIERLRLEAPGLRLEAGGALGFDGPAPVDIALDVRDLEALAAATGLRTPLAGALEARISLRGNWRRPAIIGSATWLHAAPRSAQPYRIEVELATGDGELTGTVSAEQNGRPAARGELRVPYDARGIAALVEGATSGARLELEAEDFDLAGVAPLLPRAVRDLEGRADARLTLRSGSRGPSLEGALSVRGGGVRVPVLRQSFAPIELRASFRDQTLRLAQLRVGEKGAQADVTGSARLDGEGRPAELDLEVVLTRFPLARSRPLTTDVSGRLRLAGPLTGLRLAGEVALSDTRVQLVEAGDPTLREIEVMTSDAERRDRRQMRERLRTVQVFDRAAMDVAVTVPRNSWVRGRGADIDLAGSLRLEKSAGDVMRLSGSVAAQRGSYVFQGKRFDLRRGSVTFAGGADPDPLIDLEATHRVRRVTIVIGLSGRASEPGVSLWSEPALPQDDVLSYLFFGRPTAELGSKQPAGDFERAAAALAAGVALRQASRLVEETLPIDSLEVRIREDGSAGEMGVGKYLTDDVFVRYERGFGKESADGVTIELRLSDHWSIESDASSDESAGADLVWTYDY